MAGAQAPVATAWLALSAGMGGGARPTSPSDSARAPKMARIASGSSTVAINRRRPPHRGQAPLMALPEPFEQFVVGAGFFKLEPLRPEVHPKRARLQLVVEVKLARIEGHHPPPGGRAAHSWFDEFLEEPTQAMEDEPETFRVIAKDMARKHGHDPEHLYPRLGAGFKRPGGPPWGLAQDLRPRPRFAAWTQNDAPLRDVAFG